MDWGQDKFSKIICFPQTSQLVLEQALGYERANTIYIVDASEDSVKEISNVYVSESGYAIGVEIKLLPSEFNEQGFCSRLFFKDLYIASNVSLDSVQDAYLSLIETYPLSFSHFILLELGYQRECFEFDPRSRKFPKNIKAADSLIAPLPRSGVCFSSSSFETRFAGYEKGVLYSS